MTSKAGPVIQDPNTRHGLADVENKQLMVKKGKVPVILRVQRLLWPMDVSLVLITEEECTNKY